MRITDETEGTMAFVRDEECHVCKKITSHVNGSCSECVRKENQERIAKWEAQSTAQKLTDLRERIEKLEQGPMKY